MSGFAGYFRSLGGTIAVAWSLITRDAWIHYSWLRWVLPFEIVNIGVGLATWVYFGKSMGGDVPFLKGYGGDFVSYLLVGMMLNSVLQVVFTSSYRTLAGAYLGSWSSGGVRLSMVEYLDMAGISLWIYLFASLLWSLLQVVLRVVIYLIVGALVFGVHFSLHAQYVTAVGASFLGAAACLGLGFISAGNIVLLGAWHNTEPLQWVVGLLSGLAAGVFFPPDVLPKWVRGAGQLLPQTYTLRVVRTALIQGTQEYFSRDMMILLLMALGLMVIGMFMMSCSRRLALERTAL